MSNFDLLNKAYRDYIEEYLSGIYKEFDDQPQKQLFEAMEYSLLAGGKRLRPSSSLISSVCAAATGTEPLPFPLLSK